MMMGKLSTAISMLLLFAFAEMPDKTEREAENPIAANNNSKANRPMSTTGFFNNVINKMKPTKDSSRDRTKLYISLDTMMLSGEAIE